MHMAPVTLLNSCDYFHKGSTPTPKMRSFQVPFSTCLGYFWLHSRTKRQILKNTIVKHMILERKSEPEVRKGVLGKRKRARIQKKTPPEKKTKIEYLMSHFFAAPGSKTDVKMDPEIWKKRSSTFLFSIKKNRNFQTQFFFDF